MLDEGRTCTEILQQVSAARSALEAVSYEVAACAVEAEVASAGLSDVQLQRLRGALTQLRKLR
ncbi:MAG TPA: metal-sensing transcriptional repressor [Clostridia bacterium]|nr:metal-sensing transcriptional repressor [Clostridia bacterium]